MIYLDNSIVTTKLKYKENKMATGRPRKLLTEEEIAKVMKCISEEKTLTATETETGINLRDMTNSEDLSVANVESGKILMILGTVNLLSLESRIPVRSV